jgi:flavin reductase (DIM6/NTAB) family NADH-FMN oxidoreductase RutF
MPDTLVFDPAIMDTRAGSVVPRPIGWASTVNANGVANLAPFSFFTVVCVTRR